MPRRSTKALPASPASPISHWSLGIGHSAAPGGGSLHPALAAWFAANLGTPTPAQAATLPHILAGRSVLLSSPTGTGKTLAAFLGVFDRLQRLHETDTLPAAGIVALYVSPLRALAYDLQKNLHAPLDQLGWSHLRVAARTGDTTPKERAAQRKKPPHLLVTTPESLTLLLSQPAWASALSTIRFLIIDELHALAENKRGSLLALAAERLESLVSRSSLAAPRLPLVRIGLSATAAPLPELARFLTGPSRPCEIIEILPPSGSDPAGNHESQVINHKSAPAALSVFSPLAANPYPAAGYTAVRLLRELAEELPRHRTTRIFTNTRAGAESIGLRLKQLLPDLAPLIEVHHASLDRALRLEVEDRLKRGELRAVVCSTSLELGIDIGSIDLVVMISAPKGVARALQRVGRSGHAPGRSARGLLVATNLNDLAECAATIRLMRSRALEPLRFPQNPADVLAQHLVGIAVTADTSPDEAFALVLQTHPYQHLPRDAFDRILHYLQGGGRSLEKAYAHLFGKIILTPDGHLAIPSPRIVREFYQNIGTIASEAHVTVKLGARNLGTVEESFLKGLRPGDTFVLNARCVRLVSTTLLTAKVKAAVPSELPTVPRWNANKMPLASGLAAEVVRLRTAVADLLNTAPAPSAAAATGTWSFDVGRSPEAASAAAYLQNHYDLTPANASALIRHFCLQAAVSRIPVATSLLVETCTEPASGLVHHFFHTLIGRSANDALSRIVALRIRRALGGNALVTLDDYGFLLTLRPFQSLTSAHTIRPLLARAGAESDLAEALADSELVKWQFRGVAQAGLLVPRRVGGAERGSRSLQWSAEILFDVLRRHEPDHPILAEAYAEATTRFLDLPAALSFLDTAAALPIDLVPLPRVSPFAFGLYASRIKETMTLEDPETTLERLYHEMYSHLVP
jgi:ATP-dependent Lhr-like helicase